MKFACFMETPIGRIGIAETGGAITNVFFDGTIQPERFVVKDTPLLISAISQLREYFCGKRKDFSLPLHPGGSDFQLSVWHELQKIPYGETRSYKDIALALGKPAACRAIGNANNKNPLSILIPCHRVIGINGKLTGYAGGLNAKQFLIELEQKVH